MCTKKTLYSPGNNQNIVLTQRKRGEKLNFEQICFTTECVRKFAMREDMPIVMAVSLLHDKGAFPMIYKAARTTPRLSSQRVVKEVCDFVASR